VTVEEFDKRVGDAYRRVNELGEDDRMPIKFAVSEAENAFALGIRRLLLAESMLWDAENRPQSTDEPADRLTLREPTAVEGEQMRGEVRWG
jgi:hypothetical protein